MSPAPQNHSLASVKVDDERTETSFIIITCTKSGCRRPVRPELLDERLPLCEEHQGLFADHQRWAVHSPHRGWLVDLAQSAFSWDAEAARQWDSPEILARDLQVARLAEDVSLTVLGNGRPTRVRTGLLHLRVR